MTRLAILLFSMLLVAGCSNSENQVEESSIADTKEAVALVPGDITANNVVIDHDGSITIQGDFKLAFGQPDPDTGEMVFTRQFGTPTVAGPTIVYIFKSIPDDTAELLRQREIKAEENTAYLFPYGASFETDVEAFKNMQRIGPIDPTLSDGELAALFGVGVADDEPPVTHAQ